MGEALPVGGLEVRLYYLRPAEVGAVGDMAEGVGGVTGPAAAAGIGFTVLSTGAMFLLNLYKRTVKSASGMGKGAGRRGGYGRRRR